MKISKSASEMNKSVKLITKQYKVLEEKVYTKKTQLYYIFRRYIEESLLSGLEVEVYFIRDPNKPYNPHDDPKSGCPMRPKAGKDGYTPCGFLWTMDDVDKFNSMHRLSYNFIIREFNPSTNTIYFDRCYGIGTYGKFKMEIKMKPKGAVNV